ncbi:hypothetical protein [Vibrio metschnikovii]|uniref:hypothetical protein n=1 Tax=Vibrio metschnikovii TaxID=28172 RepID=UPI002FC58D82
MGKLGFAVRGLKSRGTSISDQERVSCCDDADGYPVNGAAVRQLTVDEANDLRRDMAESSAWAKVELKRRRAVKNQKKSEHGMDDGIEDGADSK